MSLRFKGHTSREGTVDPLKQISAEDDDREESRNVHIANKEPKKAASCSKTQKPLSNVRRPGPFASAGSGKTRTSQRVTRLKSFRRRERQVPLCQRLPIQSHPRRIRLDMALAQLAHLMTALRTRRMNLQRQRALTALMAEVPQSARVGSGHLCRRNRSPKR